MATFSLCAQVIKRSAGRSAVRCAAYRAAETLHDERTDKTYSYTRKKGVEHSEILAPTDAPGWAYDRHKLWNAAERAERRQDAQPAREVRIALPLELTKQAQLELARAFIREEFVSKGMVADFAIHREKDHNPHVHIMLTMRRVGADGFAPTKERDWNRRKQLQQWREAWAYYSNRALAQEGHYARIDHRSYAARGIGLLPEPKLGIGEGDATKDKRELSLERRRLWRQTARQNGELIRHDPREALRALTSTQATFSRAELLKFLNAKTYDAEQFNACLHAVLSHPDLTQLGVDQHGEERFTARPVLAMETVLLEASRELARVQHHEVSKRALERAIASRTLYPDQRVALEYITRRTGDIAICEGYAGTGKSYMLGAALEAWEASGYQVVGGALAAVAASGLEESSGIRSRTLESWERGWNDGRDQLTDKHVLVVDEAGMIGTRQMARLLEHAREAGAKVVMVGDTGQLKPIEAGDPLRVLRTELGAALLYDIRRQTVDWQRTASLGLAQGKVVEALRDYDAQKLVHAHHDQASARDAVVKAWQRDRLAQPQVQETKKGKVGQRPATSLILSFRRDDVRALNEGARNLRRAAGELGLDHDVTVRDRDGTAHRRSFAEGDRIYFLKNDKQLKVANGTLGTIVRLQEHDWLVRLDNGREVKLDLRRYNELDHGYAATVHKGQGVTVDRTYVLASRPFTDSATYVAMTRHRFSAELHWSHEEFQKPWLVPTVAGLEARAACTAHDDALAASGGALRSYRAALDARTATPLLLTDNVDQCRALNELAREHARASGTLQKDDEYVRTQDGTKVFATGERVCLREALREQAVSAGALGTITHKQNSQLGVRLDDGRELVIDTSRYRALDHGYAVLLEQSRALHALRSIAVISEELDDRGRSLLGRAELGTLEVHGLQAPAPSANSFFQSMARQASNEQALDVQANLAEARAFAQVANHRSHYEQLPAAEQPKYLERLERLANKPALTRFEAVRAVPAVANAYATLHKAEDALGEMRGYREAFRQEAKLLERVGDIVTMRSRLELRGAERALKLAQSKLEHVLRDPSLDAQAEQIVQEHTTLRDSTKRLHEELCEARERDARTARITKHVAELNQRVPERPIRLAAASDFRRDLQYVGRLKVGRDNLLVCRDHRGFAVAFDDARVRLEAPDLQPNMSVRITAEYRLIANPLAQTQGRSR